MTQYIGHKEDAAVTDSTADATGIAALKGILERMETQLAAALGQAAMAASMPVAIANNQSAVPVSGTFYPGTQPVSIATMPSTPVTGTFWQTTQPVSGDVGMAPVACAAADVHAPAAATAAVVTYAAQASLKHCISGVAWSYYGGIPASGNLIVEDVSGTTVFNVDIHEEGPGVYYFHKPKKSAAANTAMIITLASGGAGVTGKVSILSHWTEA